MKVLHIDNHAHLGDNFYQLHFNRKLIEKNKDIKIYHYCNPSYFKELQLFIREYDDRIILKDIKNKPPESENTWIQRDGFYAARNNTRGVYFDKFHVELFDHLSKKIFKVDNPIKNVDDFLIDHPALMVDNELSDPFDFLIINSQPLSGQFHMNNSNFDHYISKLLEHDYNVITTNKTKFDDVPCTLDYDLSLLDIGNLSRYAKYIVGIHTSPFLPCFNIYNINTVKKWVILQVHFLSYSWRKEIYSSNNWKIMYDQFENIFAK